MRRGQLKIACAAPPKRGRSTEVPLLWRGASLGGSVLVRLLQTCKLSSLLPRFSGWYAACAPRSDNFGSQALVAGRAVGETLFCVWLGRR